MSEKKTFGFLSKIFVMQGKKISEELINYGTVNV